ncbi:MAG: hypothetical protein RIG77_14620 [Cyclobacteriaceae bacterium]
MKNDLEKDVQEKVFETHHNVDFNDLDAHLYQKIGDALSEEDEGPGLSVDFAARVVELAMAKPLWKRILHSLMWFLGVFLSAGLGIYGVLYAVGLVVPVISLDFSYLLDKLAYLVFIVALFLVVEVADVLLVKKKSTKELLSLFD